MIPACPCLRKLDFQRRTERRRLEREAREREAPLGDTKALGEPDGGVSEGN